MTEQNNNNTNAQGKRKPGWMLIPGGPKEASFTEFHGKLQKLSGEKSKLFDRLAEIRTELDAGRGEGEDDTVRSERKRLQDRMREIREERKSLNGLKEDKFSERQGLQSERRALQKQIEEFSDELSGLDSLDSIEYAIDRVLIHMETGSGSLKSEKKTLKRITQLEKAKSMVRELKLLEERSGETQQEELELGQEYARIRQQIENLDKQFKTVAEAKGKMQERQQVDNVGRDKLKKEREDVRKNIDEYNEKIKELRADFDKSKEAWNVWREKAIKIYAEEKAAKDAEYQKIREEREAARKADKKRAKAAKRLNPYAAEIDACTALIRYLNDKSAAHKSDVERMEHEKKLSEFNAAATAPKGFTVRNDDEEDSWAFGDRTKKVQKQKAPKKKAEAPKKDDSKPREKVMNHNRDRITNFELVNVDKPLSYSQIPSTVETLKEKKKEYETHIKSLDDISTQDDEEEQEDLEEEAAAAEASEEKKDEEKTEEEAPAKEEATEEVKEEKKDDDDDVEY